MAGGTNGLDVRSIETLFGVGSVAGLTDGQLLEHFVNRQSEASEAAFTALVALHSPMVWKVCRNLLRRQAIPGGRPLVDVSRRADPAQILPSGQTLEAVSGPCDRDDSGSGGDHPETDGLPQRSVCPAPDIAKCCRNVGHDTDRHARGKY